MIARLGHFDSFDMTDREYVVEAIKDRPGFRGVYHLVDRESGRALSISFFDSEEDAGAAQRRWARRGRPAATAGRALTSSRRGR